MLEVIPGDSGDSKGDINFSLLPGIKSLPPFLAVATKLLAVISDEDVDFREVSRLIMTDAALSNQVVRVANSPLFGFSQEVKSILMALCLAGANRVRDPLVKEYIRPDDTPVLRDCWRHSLATGRGAGEVVTDRPMIYTAGILHDLARIGLFAVVAGKVRFVCEKRFGMERV